MVKGGDEILRQRAQRGDPCAIVALLDRDSDAAWAAIEIAFGAEIARIAHRRAVRAGLSRDDGADFAQEIRLHLMADGGAALRRFDNRGSLAGFIRRLANNIAEDLVRGVLGRRRAPKAVLGLDALAQEIFRLLHVQQVRADHLALHLRDTAGNPIPQSEIDARVARLDAAMAGRLPQRRPRSVPLTIRRHDKGEIERPLPVAFPSAEDGILANEDAMQIERAVDALEAAMAELPEDARLYLRLRFLAEPPLPPRKIAEVMNLPVEALYTQRQHWERLLRTALRTRGVEKFPIPSV